MYTLKIQLIYSSPSIWRRVLVDSNTTLHELHSIIQVLFDWHNSHLHNFQVATPRPAPDATMADIMSHVVTGCRVFSDGGDAGFEDEVENDVTVGELLGPVGDRLVYEYDFGDSWMHNVVVEAVEPYTEENENDEVPRCIGGRYAAPVDDSGGIAKHAMMVHAYRKKHGLLPQQRRQQQPHTNEHKQQQQRGSQQPETKEAAEDEDDEDGLGGEYDDDNWSGQVEGWLKWCSKRNGRKYDPLRFDRQRVNTALKEQLGWTVGRG